MANGQESQSPNQPDKGRSAIYRTSLGPDSCRYALCATVVGSRGETSGESQLRPSGENGTWSVSADRIFGNGDAMEQRNVIIALFVMIGLLMIANVYTMYQVNWAIKMIGLLVENIPK